MVTRDVVCLAADEVGKTNFYYYMYSWGGGIYSVWLVAIDNYIKVVKKMYFLFLFLRMYAS